VERPVEIAVRERDSRPMELTRLRQVQSGNRPCLAGRPQAVERARLCRRWALECRAAQVDEERDRRRRDEPEQERARLFEPDAPRARPEEQPEPEPPEHRRGTVGAVRPEEERDAHRESEQGEGEPADRRDRSDDQRAKSAVSAHPYGRSLAYAGRFSATASSRARISVTS